MDSRRAVARLGAVIVVALAVAPAVAPAASARPAPQQTTSTTAAPPPPTTPTTPPPPTAPTTPTTPPTTATTSPGPVGPASLGAPDVGDGLPVGDAHGAVDPSLARVAVAGPELRAAEAAVRAADAAIADAEAAIVAADAAIVAADGAIADAEAAVGATLEDQRRATEEVASREAVERDVQARIDRLSAEEQANANALEATRRRLQELAVASYVGGGDAMTFDALLSSESSTQYGRLEVFAEVADARLQDRITAYRAARDAASAAAAEAADELAVARRDTDAARQAVADAVAAEAAWRAEREARVVARAERVAERDERIAERDARLIERDERLVERGEATVMAWVVGADFPLVVLDAYQRAAVAAGQAGCAIPWTALAGIGRVESRHGTYRGATIDETGRVAPPIIGIALTGAGGTAAIGDTDGGFFDGDTVHDRAVGPMQFIPSTWRAYGRDGDGDGAVDPQVLYDAAAAAANYLCHAAGGALTSDASMTRAFLAYNHSGVYARTVLSYVKAYAALGLPIG